jgi:hypothetical protein
MYQFYYGFVKRCRAPRLDSGTNRVLYIQLPLNAPLLITIPST